MAISVNDLLNHSDLIHGGVVHWGQSLPENSPGIYIVSSSPDTHDSIGQIGQYSANYDVLSQLKALVPNIAVDGVSASVEQIAQRLGQFWIPDTPILYMGLAGTSIRQRVNQYYSTKIGANSPHSGGWWLKTMTNLDDLYVHFAATNDSTAVEQRMIDAFADAVPMNVSQQLFDSERIAPFANVEVRKGLRKQHGLDHFKVSKKPLSPRVINPPPEKQNVSPVLPTRALFEQPSSIAKTFRVHSQQITASDRLRPVLRIPSGSKHAFPDENSELEIRYRGQRLTALWRARIGRSSTIGLGRPIMSEIGVTNRPVLLEVTGTRVTIIE